MLGFSLGSPITTQGARTRLREHAQKLFGVRRACQLITRGAEVGKVATLFQGDDYGNRLLVALVQHDLAGLRTEMRIDEGDIRLFSPDEFER